MKNHHFSPLGNKPIRKFLSVIVAVLFLIISCNKSDSGSGQLFRQIYNNTSWVDSYGSVYNFSPSRIFTLSDASGCYFVLSGNYSNVDYDGCVYASVDNIIITEDNDTFSARQQVSSNGVGSSCGGGGDNAVLTFEVLDENTMEIQLSYDGVIDETIIINKTTTLSPQGCVDGTQNGYLW